MTPAEEDQARRVEAAKAAERARWKRATCGLENGGPVLDRAIDLLSGSNLSAEQIRAQIAFTGAEASTVN